MNTKTSTETAATCTACRSLSAVGMQCNRHRRTAPNARTLKQREILAYMREQGCTAAEAEAHFGVTAGPVIA